MVRVDILSDKHELDFFLVLLLEDVQGYCGQQVAFFVYFQNLKNWGIWREAPRLSYLAFQVELQSVHFVAINEYLMSKESDV
jgi:hypothetical protein